MRRPQRKPRVLVAKMGLDGHNRGALVVAHGLRQAGLEVIYTGLRQRPSAVARAAIQESVDVIGISSMVGAHLSVVKKLMAELRALNAPEIHIILGGIVPEEDYEPLRAAGVSRIFPTGTAIARIVEYIYSIEEGAYVDT
jgi:methylmalonyl-CoA mutase C-terminal domain/subunit